MGELSPTGWVARYSSSTDLPDFDELAVEKFSDDGDALVVNTRSGGLIIARALDGFIGLSECDRVLSAVQSPPGWRVVGQDAADGTEWREPVVAWLVTDTGTGQPLIADRECGRLDLAMNLSTEYTLRSPDDPDPPTTTGRDVQLR